MCYALPDTSKSENSSSSDSPNILMTVLLWGTTSLLVTGKGEISFLFVPVQGTIGVTFTGDL
jgi:hypothetical protein